jgi:hypothetical protein
MPQRYRSCSGVCSGQNQVRNGADFLGQTCLQKKFLEPLLPYKQTFSDNLCFENIEQVSAAAVCQENQASIILRIPVQSWLEQAK